MPFLQTHRPLRLHRLLVPTTAREARAPAALGVHRGGLGHVAIDCFITAPTGPSLLGCREGAAGRVGGQGRVVRGGGRWHGDSKEQMGWA